MKNIAIYGAGGLGREIACIINSINKKSKKWKIIGFFDDGLSVGEKNEYGAILGGIEELNNYPEKLDIVLAIANPLILAKLIGNIQNPNINFPNIVAPDILFYDEDNFSMGKGNIIGFKTIISCNITIGNFNILNTDIIIGHDSKIGDYNIFNPSTRISGEVIIGNSNFFGVGCVILQQKVIGNNVTIGANSLIIRKTKDNTVYIGNPAVELKY